MIVLSRQLIVFLAMTIPCTSISAQGVKAMTYNIRFDNIGDGADRWDLRKEAVVDYVKKERPAVLGTQEGQYHQLGYMAESLDSYQFVGVGRDQGDTTGEHTALFYDVSVLDILDFGTFWLSETGDTGTLGWDAAITRICTYAQFRDKSTGRQFKVFNGHFDHVGPMARAGSARQIADSAVVSISKGIPVIVLGDFNSEPETEAFKVLNEVVPCAANFVDGAPDGPEGTYTAFDTEVEPTRRIDYIFISGFDVLTYEHHDPRTHAGRAASDHLPVVAELLFD